ncbi:unnamed protein product [Prunus armeniaca]|uniref:Uncharacterized protein n=1 Tax=Prunus armeniaca TaxID=36596 RepID=A0A6J5XAC5_PRUAR|nr:unnamed protein product [Prunus armeniaca]
MGHSKGETEGVREREREREEDEWSSLPERRSGRRRRRGGVAVIAGGLWMRAQLVMRMKGLKLRLG